MQISVLADDDGTILATLRPSACGRQGPTEIQLRGRPGQSVYHLILPEELGHLSSLISLHRTHRVDSSGGEARLVIRPGL